MRSIHPLAALVVGALALTGCGGDGGDGGDGGEPGVPLTAITTENAAKVSAVAFQAARGLFFVASSATLPVGAVVQAGSGSTAGLGLVGAAARQVKAATRRPLSPASGVVGAVYQDTYACTGGGTVTERIDDADGNQDISVGDSLRLTFENCVEDGVTSNGVLAWKVTTISDASIGAKVTLGNFSSNDGTDLIEGDGGFDLTVTQNAGVSEVYQVAGDTLTSALNGDRHTVTGFTGSATTDAGTGAVTYAFAGRVNDSSQNVSVDVQTVADFVAQQTDDFPSSGALRAIGAGNSQALLEALSSTLVRISADPEGDGSFTTPVEWSWSALEGLMD